MAAASTPHASEPSPVIPLSALGAGDLDRAGGKAANLGELLRAGLPVPPGVVITTDAYVAAAHRAGLDALLADPATPPSALRSALEAAPITRDLDREIRRAYQGLRGPGGARGVRRRPLQRHRRGPARRRLRRAAGHRPRRPR